jgi:hypothetical protein
MVPLQAQAVMGGLKHGPYPAPIGWKRDLSHLDKCLACDIQQNPSSWPKEFSAPVLGQQQSFIGDYLVSNRAIEQFRLSFLFLCTRR